MHNHNQGLHVVFGTGPAGMAVARSLLNAGQQVRVVNRSGRLPPTSPNGIEAVAADATNPGNVYKAAECATVIYLCLNTPYDKWSEMFLPLQAGVLKGAIDLGARLVALENLYMYGEVDGPMTEDLPHNTVTKKGRVRSETSRLLVEAHERGKVEVAIGRASDFYGPTVIASALGERTFGPLVQGKPAEAIGDPDQPHSYAYIEDVGKGLALLGLRDEAFGKVWHLPHAPAVTTREMLQQGFGYVGLEPKIRSVNRVMLGFGGLFSPLAREMIEMLYEFEKPFVVDSSLFARQFGAHYTPIKIGVGRTVDWYLRNAQLA